MRGILLFSLSFLLLDPTSAQNRYYVSQNAMGGAETGATWADAFTGLQQALTVATTGDTIWVAAGTYKPTTMSDRTMSFVLKDGVALYGGFSGIETELAGRDIEQYKTILSGDIGAMGISTDNAYHVVRGKGLGNGTLLDGFYIRDGYSYNDFPPTALDRYGAGMLLEGAPGVADSRPVIQNCVFENNNAQEGGALCATWTDFSNQPGFHPVNPVLRNCTFSRNTASRNGGGFYKNGPSAPQDTFVLEDCRFLDNKAFTGKGGGVHFNLRANSSIVVRRCLFERDTSWGDSGGAISYYVDPIDTLNVYCLSLDSCVFFKNLALEGGGLGFDGFTSFIFGNSNKVKFDCRIQYCNFSNNLARSGDGAAYYMISGDGRQLNVDVDDCLFEGNLSNDITTAISFYEYNVSHLKMRRCIFSKNIDRAGSNRLCMAVNHGGGAFNTVTTEITNCLFFENGGGVASTSGARNYNTTRVANCTFFDNNEYIFVKTWDTIFNQPNGYFNDFFIDNCIIWEPGTDLRKMFYNNEPLVSNMYGYHVNHTLLNLSDSTSVPGAGDVFQEGILWGQFPGFQDSLTGDFRLKPCSPAVNKGNNDVVFGHGLQDDLDGLPRIRYGVVDLGAYEQQDSCMSVRAWEHPGTSSLNLWPNPSPDGVMHFSIPDAVQGMGWLRIFDVQGREVFQIEIVILTENTLNTQNLPPGFYTVKLETARGEFLAKWVRH